MPCAERKAEEMRSTLIFAKVASYCKAHAIGALSQQVAWSAASAPACGKILDTALDTSQQSLITTRCSQRVSWGVNFKDLGWWKAK